MASNRWRWSADLTIRGFVVVAQPVLEWWSTVRRSFVRVGWLVGCLLSGFLLLPGSFAATYFVDGWAGSNVSDGLTATAQGQGHGPLRNIAAALAISATGDTIKVAAGFYQELNWLPTGQNLELATRGTVFISDADPFMTDSDGDGIPDAWEAAHGLNPFNTTDASWASLQPFAHGLSNLLVYQHPSVLSADNFSTVRDGIPDWWKVKYGLPVDDPSVAYAAANHDGYTNLQEYQSKRNPLDPVSYPINSRPDVAGWWPFDEGSGTNTASLVGTNLTGTLVGDPLPTWTSGIFSNALGFDGVQNEVVVADDPQLSPTNALSITAWVKTALAMTSEVVAKWSTNAVAGSYLLSLTNGQVMLELMLNGRCTALVGQAAGLSDTNWHHIAGSYDGSTMQVYVDGAIVGSQLASGSVAVVDAPLRMGLLSGQLDDVRLYNQALPPDYVSGLVNADSVGDGIPDWWRKHYFGSSSSTNSRSCVSCDLDGDGFSNWEEYLNGTDPNNAISRPTVQPIAVLSIPNAWAIYTSSNIVQVTADIRSTNQYVVVKAAEFFVDCPRATGTGIAMNLNNAGRRDSTNVTATGAFTPTFPSGERHELFAHAQGKDEQWCPYKKIIINPNVNDILDKIATNYSAFADLQFTATLTETHNSVFFSTHTAMYRMKGPYKTRTDYDSGTVVIKNENKTWWYNASLNIGGSLVSAVNGDSSTTANRKSDFFWDVPLSKTQTDAAISNSVRSADYDIQLTPKSGSIKPAQHARVDANKGLVSTLDENVADVLIKSEYFNPIEVIHGHWLHTLHRYTMDFASGDKIEKETIITEILVNQGLPDSLFDVPTH